VTFTPTFEAKKGVSEAGNTMLTLNQPVLGSSPRRLTLDTEFDGSWLTKHSGMQLLG